LNSKRFLLKREDGFGSFAMALKGNQPSVFILVFANKVTGKAYGLNIDCNKVQYFLR